ncbi:hypothetical protein FKM82_021461 [Ascaphus truei]
MACFLYYTRSVSWPVLGSPSPTCLSLTLKLPAGPVTKKPCKVMKAPPAKRDSTHLLLERPSLY